MFLWLQIAWLRVDTQTILTIHNHVITKNHRIGVTHSDHRTWHLHIRDVRESDRGWYMCQINTDPMKSQVGFLQVTIYSYLKNIFKKIKYFDSRLSFHPTFSTTPQAQIWSSVRDSTSH